MDSFTFQVILSFSRVELLIVFITIPVLIASLYVTICRGDEERAIEYTVPLPEQVNDPLKGPVLETPTIKVVRNLSPFQTNHFKSG